MVVTLIKKKIPKKGVITYPHIFTMTQLKRMYLLMGLILCSHRLRNPKRNAKITRRANRKGFIICLIL